MFTTQMHYKQKTSKSQTVSDAFGKANLDILRVQCHHYLCYVQKIAWDLHREYVRFSFA